MTKFNPAGSAFVYSTYLGGHNLEYGQGIAVDSAGNAYVTGVTYSTDFPITPGAFQTVCGDMGYQCDYGSAFVSKLNSAGSALVYSSYLGGSNYEYGSGIAVDSAGSAYVTGVTYSDNFPTTPGAFQTTCNGGSNCSQFGDAFVTKINPTGSALVYSTYLGGSGGDGGSGIAVDSAGNAYVTGGTGSTDFPTMNPLQPAYGGGGDAFVSKINSVGSALVYSTYLGGSGGDGGSGIAVDSAGNAYVTGGTGSTDFPTTNAGQPAYGGSGDAFVSKINSAGSALVYSTYLGGSGGDGGSGIAVDSLGNAYVIGSTSSTDFPTMDPLQPKYGGNYDAFVTKITPDVTLTPQNLNVGNQIVGTTSTPQVSTLTYTGTATLTIGSISVTGANSGDFAETNNCGTSVPAGGSCTISVTFTPTALGTRTGQVTIPDNNADSLLPISLTGIGLNKEVTTVALGSSPNPSTSGQAVTFIATVTSSAGAPPDGETVRFMKGATVLGTGC